MGEVVRIPLSLGYTVSAGLISGAFLGYLSSSQELFQEEYHVGTNFPLYFAALAIAIGSASFVNGKLVLRWGAGRMAIGSCAILCIASALFLLVQCWPRLCLYSWREDTALWPAMHSGWVNLSGH